MINLQFVQGQAGSFTFDTGVLKGVLRQEGQSIGLVPVTYTVGGTGITTGEGLLNHYRVFTRGKRYGYGNLVEINHGNGYVTRYGHAKEVLVKVGEAVKKGHKIALMGNTGRSTGPHVHFEVWMDGKTVNPSKYIQASK